MHSRLEKEIEQKVVDWWETGGGLQLKLNILGRRGWPDRAFFPYGGSIILIEFKRVGKDAEALQAHIHGELRKRGYRVFICDSVDQGKAILASAKVSEGRC